MFKCGWLCTDTVSKLCWWWGIPPAPFSPVLNKTIGSANAKGPSFHFSLLLASRVNPLWFNQTKVNIISISDPARPINMFPCNLTGCRMTFKTIQEFISHNDEPHFLDSQHTCPACDHVSDTKPSFVEHFDTTHRHHTSPCDLCTAEFNTLKALRQHFILVHGLPLNRYYWSLFIYTINHFTIIHL